MTNKEFKLERQGEYIVLQRFKSPQGGYIALLCKLVGEDPSIQAVLPNGEVWTWNCGCEFESMQDNENDSIMPTDFGNLRAEFKQAWLLHTKICNSHDMEGKTGYAYLASRPHIKGFLLDVTRGYTNDWLSDHRVLRVEETWFFDDSRRFQISSFLHEIKAYAISERVAEMIGETAFGELTPEMQRLKEKASSELIGFEEYVDYFPASVFADYDAGPITDSEVFALMTGKIAYQSIIDSYSKYFWENEIF